MPLLGKDYYIEPQSYFEARLFDFDVCVVIFNVSYIKHSMKSILCLVSQKFYVCHFQ